ncbi:aminotransferase class I/II-fold pyridoxal phosphate-dependent enzyme [Mucilaginibacter sp. X5P1]|uniref:aminotransferase class I/II-fold pyridoxal phosphate-dependent enzyme n=1 Tax=Mucilaginibacter sp. X5P1 TaxID=2723088 RepID=UPI00161F0C3B|nr:aminotransferase class I/II-fold pyridoxal phosphate-dependent enzyme [Mucilaginibacter sp. X5P1]MBB6141674.1 glycine C-acetyltransferase [Mucilaginibacter sp. X5P1]
MNKNYQNLSFKDFENMEGLDLHQTAQEFSNYIEDWDGRDHWNYRQESLSGCKPDLDVMHKGILYKNCVGLVFNDYLGFTNHPKVKQAAIEAIERYGVGAAASPAIGGHMSYHRQIEEKIAEFFKRDSAMIYTTGYTANSATIQALLKKEDLAILDEGVHASMWEGAQMTNLIKFPHNNMDRLERALKESQGNYRNRMVIIDGVYSQQADIALLDQIVKLCKHYGAYLAMDDAHGIGVIGKNGRGVIELYDLYQEVDIITGTFSKTFGHLGGYVIASPNIIKYLQFQSRQHIFSVTATPASACILKSIDLIDEEPFWKDKLWENINYLKNGLIGMGFDLGNTQSAIIPVMTGNPNLNAEACHLLMKAGVYANQIGYPAVPKKRARIRMSIMATHSLEQMDKLLNAWDWVDRQLLITKKNNINNGDTKKEEQEMERRGN